MARLHIQLDGAPVLSRELKWGITRIGRGADNDMVISHPSLSQHHCEMELGIDFLKVRDLGSTNGTTVGNRTVSEAFLAPGETLWFGQVPATVEWSQESVNVPESKHKGFRPRWNWEKACSAASSTRRPLLHGIARGAIDISAQAASRTCAWLAARRAGSARNAASQLFSLRGPMVVSASNPGGSGSRPRSPAPQVCDRWRTPNR